MGIPSGVSVAGSAAAGCRRSSIAFTTGIPWKSTKSKSGTGSALDQTQALIAALPALLRTWDVRSLLDIPCGDFNWMRHVDLAGLDYLGADVVPRLVEANQRSFAAPGIEFRVLDLVNDPLPRTDLILCRDCIVHLSFKDAKRALQNLAASGATYLLATTFTDRDANADCKTGKWRVLNLEKAPFDLPPPLQVLNEGCTEGDGMFGDKSLGLWRLADIGQLDG